MSFFLKSSNSKNSRTSISRRRCFFLFLSLIVTIFFVTLHQQVVVVSALYDVIDETDDDEDDNDNDGLQYITKIQNSKQWEKQIQNSNDIWFVNLYREQECDACEMLEPTIIALAKELHPYGIKIAVLDIDNPDNKKAIKSQNIQMLPTMKLIFGKGTKNPYTGKFIRPDVQYIPTSPQMTTRTIKSWIMKQLPGNIERMESSKEFHELVGKLKSSDNDNDNDKTLVISFTEKRQSSPLFKTIATLYMEKYDSQKVVFVEIHKDEEDIVEKFGITSFPSLVIQNELQKDDSKFITFDGNCKDATEIISFIDQYVVDGGDDDDDDSSSSNNKDKNEEKKNGGTKKKKSSNDDMEIFTDKESFDEKVLQSEDAWILFHSNNDNKVDILQKIPNWKEKLSAKIEGLVKAGIIDCKSLSAFCTDADDDNDNDDKDYITMYEYSSKGVKAMKDFEIFKLTEATDALKAAQESLPNKVLVLPGSQIDEQTMDSIIAQSIQSGRLPLTIISKKDEPSPMIKSIANAFEAKVTVIQLANPSPAVMQRLSAPKIPTVMLFFPMPNPPPDIVEQSGGQIPLQAGMYDPRQLGPISFQSLSAFLNEFLRLTNMDTETNTDGSSSSSSNGADFSGSGGSGELTEVNNESWERLCPEDSSLLCAIAFFDGTSKDGFEKDKKVLENVLKKETSSPIEFVWVDTACQPEFASGFGVSLDSSPTVVVYSPKKSRSSNFVGTFNEKSIRDFLRGIVTGRIGTSPIASIGKIADVDNCEDAHVANGYVQATVDFVDEDMDEDMDDLMAEILREEEEQKKELEEQLKREAKEAKEKKKLEEEKKKQEEAEAAAKAKKAKKKKSKKKKKKTVKDEL